MTVDLDALSQLAAEFRSVSVLLRFEAGDVDALWRALGAAGVRKASPAADRPPVFSAWPTYAHGAVQVVASEDVAPDEVWAVYSDGRKELVCKLPRERW